MTENWQDPFAAWARQDAQKLVARAGRACVASHHAMKRTHRSSLAGQQPLSAETVARLQELLGRDEG